MATIKQLFHRTLITIGSLALVTSLGFSGVMYFGNRSLERTNLQQSTRIASLDRQVDQLNRAKHGDETQIALMLNQLQTMLPDYDKLKQSIGAFASQAAACETLRQSLNIKS